MNFNRSENGPRLSRLTYRRWISIGSASVSNWEGADAGLGLAVFGGPPGIAAGLVTAGLSLGVGAFGLANVAAGRFYCHT